MSDELIARLRGHKSGAMFIDNTADRAWQKWMRDVLADSQLAADRLERAERVVEAARAVRAAEGEAEATAMLALYAALRDYDTPDGGARSNAPRDYHTTAGVPIEPAARPCPNSVSFCGGPDRYGDTCAACLATWTEEAKEKTWRYDESDDMCPNCVTPWKCNGPHLNEQTKAAAQHKAVQKTEEEPT